jgi:hypothetical protein
MTVVLHEEADGASRNLEDGVGDAKRAVGKTSKGVTLEDAEEFSVDTVGDKAVGLSLIASVDSGQKLALYQTIIAFRRGRPLGTVRISRLDNGDVREEAVALARKLDTRVLDVLRPR